MAEKARSFILAPSKLGRNPTQADDSNSSTKPNFTGLKESKLGILAESKLTPSSGSVSVTAGKPGEESEDKKVPQTFNFAPLTKPTGEDVLKEKTADEENKNPNLEPKPADKSDSSQFVFGQNLNQRVENVSEEAGKVKNGETEDAEKTEKEEEEEDGSKVESQSEESSKTDLLFTNSVSPSTKNDEEGSKSTSKTLHEAAAEYTESHSNKRKYEVVDVVTGEEEESNVLQANVKLYIFESEKKNWVERGRGSLRLNDDPSSTPGHLRSRLVMRTVGTLRIVLNTKLFPNMKCEKANEKNVRISALEENEIKVFLISASPKDAEKIYKALEYRINQLNSDKKDDSGDDDQEPPEKKAAKSEEA